MSKSRRRSASDTSASPPEFFVDRSLGRYEVPDALREAGLTVHTMADIYGEDWGQRLEDETWLSEVAAAGWVALFKDDAIKRRPAQIAAVEAGNLRCFCLTNGQPQGRPAGPVVPEQHRPHPPRGAQARTIRLRRL